MADSLPFELMPADRADPQDAAIDLMDVLRALVDEAWRQRNLLVGERATSPTGRDQARARAIELAALADDALALAEQAIQAQRAGGGYRHDYRAGR